MVQIKEKRGIGKKQPAQIVSVAASKKFCAIAERVFCRKASAILGVEKQAGEKRVGCYAPTRRFTTPGNASRFKGFRAFWCKITIGVADDTLE